MATTASTRGRVAEAPVRAGVYCRLSRAVDGSTEKVDDQERICRELAGRLGWEVAGVYCDNNESAWKKNRRRPRWDAMLEDVEAGLLDALVVYHGDRLIRHPKDLEKLIDLADTRGIKLAAPTGVRNIDNDDDRTMMRVEVAFAWRESANTSRRKRLGFERMRRQGLVRKGGIRALGFESDGVTHVPSEVAAIRDAAAALLAGKSLRSVTAELDARGIRATTGNPLQQNVLRRILLSPRIAGLMPGDDFQPAAWEAVLDMVTWQMLHAVLGANKAQPRAGLGALHLLSGIAECGECHHVLYAGRNANGPAYRCPRRGCGRVVRSTELLDAFVSGAVVTRLNLPANPRPALQLHDGLAAELSALTRHRAETEEAIARLAETPGQRIDVLARALEGFDRKIEQVRTRMAEGSNERLLTAHANISREEFAALPLDVRRSLVRGTYRVVVLRASGRGPGFRVQDVVLDPVTGS